MVTPPRISDTEIPVSLKRLEIAFPSDETSVPSRPSARVKTPHAHPRSRVGVRVGAQCPTVGEGVWAGRKSKCGIEKESWGLFPRYDSKGHEWVG